MQASGGFGFESDSWTPKLVNYWPVSSSVGALVCTAEDRTTCNHVLCPVFDQVSCRVIQKAPLSHVVPSSWVIFLHSTYRCLRLYYIICMYFSPSPTLHPIRMHAPCGQELNLLHSFLQPQHLKTFLDLGGPHEIFDRCGCRVGWMGMDEEPYILVINNFMVFFFSNTPFGLGAPFGGSLYSRI